MGGGGHTTDIVEHLLPPQRGILLRSVYKNVEGIGGAAQHPHPVQPEHQAPMGVGLSQEAHRTPLALSSAQGALDARPQGSRPIRDPRIGTCS